MPESHQGFVLIESDWNLKEVCDIDLSERSDVLIESDWNLKKIKSFFEKYLDEGINRIRLEFKVNFDGSRFDGSDMY